MFTKAWHLAATLALVAGTGPMAQAAPQAAPLAFYVGMHGAEIRKGTFNPADGTLTIDGVVAQVPRPTWTLAHPTLPVLYAANEVGNDGDINGSVYAFRVDRKTGALTKLGEQDAGGGGTTYLTLDARSHTLLAANYGAGSVASFPIAKDGSIGPRASLVVDTGSGPHKRQAKPHAHAPAVVPWRAQS